MVEVEESTMKEIDFWLLGNISAVVSLFVDLDDALFVVKWCEDTVVNDKSIIFVVDILIEVDDASLSFSIEKDGSAVDVRDDVAVPSVFNDVYVNKVWTGEYSFIKLVKAIVGDKFEVVTLIFDLLETVILGLLDVIAAVEFGAYIFF